MSIARVSVEIVHVHRRFLSHSLIRTASLPLLSLSPPLSLSRPLALSLSQPRPYPLPPSLSVVEMPGPVVWVEKEVFVEKQVFVEVIKEITAPKRGWFSWGFRGKGAGYVLCVRAPCPCALYY